jgi:mRNA interferase RelE/StbE
MASYEIEISRTAEKQLKKLPPADQRRVARAMLALADDPFPRGSRKLSGYEDIFRVRIGRYRIVYSVSEKRLIIIVLKIGHRKDIYR